MLGFTSLSLVAALFSALSLIWTIPVLGVVVDSPPSFLLTTDVSPECAGINSGKYLCCAVAVQGDSELVIELSNSVGSQPPQNSVNGLQCSDDFDICDAGEGKQLCCEVTAFLPAAGLWCQYP